MNILGIDPGTEKSAYVCIQTDSPFHIFYHSILPNDFVLRGFRGGYGIGLPGVLGVPVIEMIGHYGTGMSVGKDVFETVRFIGRLEESLERLVPQVHIVYRPDVKMHFCHTMRAKDTNIRQALIDRFGPPGTKKNPGLLYGIKADEWQALSVAIFFADTHKLLI